MNHYSGRIYRGVQALPKVDKAKIAKILGIPAHLIVRIEYWAYVIFVHRRDSGGQFVSYRKLLQWLQMVAFLIHKCMSRRELESVWSWVKADFHKHRKQYHDKFLDSVFEVYRQCWGVLFQLSHLEYAC